MLSAVNFRFGLIFHLIACFILKAFNRTIFPHHIIIAVLTVINIVIKIDSQYYKLQFTYRFYTDQFLLLLHATEEGTLLNSTCQLLSISQLKLNTDLAFIDISPICNKAMWQVCMQFVQYAYCSRLHQLKQVRVMILEHSNSWELP